ncbi:MAG: transporter substrate-binding domain-containing protein [Desulfobacteraceae bacterium]|nr:transporter substrate-binding domain-containing protein [Desulfobacteraceae bacterium]
MKKIVFFMLLGCCVYSNQVIAETVKVGGYVFPPFLEEADSQYVGMTIDLIDEMNSFQKKYKFQFVSTSRFLNFDERKFDLIMFEDKAWGWEGRDIAASKVFLKGGEVYITKAEFSKDQSYFDNFKNKSVAAILGYHYGFANFNSDEKFLKDNFNIQLSSAHEGNIRKVLMGRADISVVTLSYLNRLFKLNPDIRKALLVSEKFDQRYNHTILLRKNSKIDVKEVEALLTKMKEAGVLSRIWKKYGIPE